MPGKTRKYTTLNAMLAGMERLYLMIMVGLVFPILLGLAGWWGSLPFVPEDTIQYFALGGFMLGVLADILLLRSWVHNALRVPLIWPVLVYLFYSVGMFGFFMGVPAFNVIMGPLGGYYMGMRLRAKNSDQLEVEKTARQSGLFTALILAIACTASLVIAWQDPSLEANISGMFALAQPLSKTTILALSGAAGLGLVMLEYTITRAAVKFARFLD